MMMNAVGAMAVLALQLPGTVADTVVTVPAGQALEVITRSGTINVEAWARDEVEVTGIFGEGVGLEVKAGTTVEVQERRPPRAALERTDLRIRLPAGMAVTLVSDDAQVEVRGMRSAVSVNVNHGSVTVGDVAGNIMLDSSTGSLFVIDSRGDAALDTSAGDITVHGLAGGLVAESVAGSVEVRDVRGPEVRVTSSRGNVRYQGEIVPGSVVDLASQSGEVVLALPGDVSADFQVGTARGRFITDFDLGGLMPARGEKFGFTLGSGAGRVSAITYSGDIRVLRSGER